MTEFILMTDFGSCLKKQEEVKKLFEGLSEEARYEKIIGLGKKLIKLNPDEKTPANFVPGCQSAMYLISTFKEGKVYFNAESDALISAGLASILIEVYSGETPESILKCPPSYLEELGISASLTPSRANGLYSIHLKMKKEALRFLMEKPN